LLLSLVTSKSRPHEQPPTGTGSCRCDLISRIA
jgi:hypothetical protein